MKALRRLAPLALVALLTACGGGAGSPAGPSSPADAAPVPSGPAGFATTPFGGNVVLGSPTATSVRVNVYAADLSGEIAISYGTSPGVYGFETTPEVRYSVGTFQFSVSSLASGTTYSAFAIGLLADGSLDAKLVVDAQR